MDSETLLKNSAINFTDELIYQGATYASVILTKGTDVVVYHSSNDKWDEIYHETGYSKECHLISAVKKILTKQKDIALIWDMIQPNNETSKYLNEMRSKNKMFHGVSFCKKSSNGITQIVTLTGRDCDTGFARNVIEQKNNILYGLTKVQALSKISLI